MKRILPMLAAAALAPGIAHAQASFDLRLQPSLERWDGAPAAQGAVAGGAAAEYEFASTRGRLFYTLDGGTFAAPGDWSYFEHGAGLTWRFGSGTRHVFFGAGGTLRRNGPAWSAADYGGLSAMANVELGLGAKAKLRAGYRLTGRDFSGLPAIDHVEHDAFSSLLLNLPSRTTLLGEAHLGVKAYAGAERAGLLTVIGRAAQSLAERTGLSVQVSGRLTSGDVPPLLVTTPPAFLDDGVYDDPFASDALAVGAALKHVFEGGSVLEAEGSWQRKDYVATLALDAGGVPLGPDVLRMDETWRGQVRASLPVWPARTQALSLRLEIAWSYLDRASNDAFHDHSAQAVSAGVSLSY